VRNEAKRFKAALFTLMLFPDEKRRHHSPVDFSRAGKSPTR
jgi:hypothetical protein